MLFIIECHNMANVVAELYLICCGVFLSLTQLFANVVILTSIHSEQQLPVHHRPLLAKLLRSFHWISIPPK